MNCPYCNKEIGQNPQGKFCPACGHRFVRCSTCGTILTKKVKFCPKDGTKIPEELMDELPAAAVGAAAAASVKKVSQTQKSIQKKSQSTGQQKTVQNRQQPSGKQKTDNSISTQKSSEQKKSSARPKKSPAGEPVKPVNSSKKTAPEVEEEAIEKVSKSRRPEKETGSKKPILLGLLAFILILILGLGGYFAVNMFLSQKSSDTSEYASSDRDTGKRVADDSEEDEQEDEMTASVSSSSDSQASYIPNTVSTSEDSSSGGVTFAPEGSDSSGNITATVSKVDSSAASGLNKVKFSKCSSSSVVTDNEPGYTNEAEQMVDGDEVTSWQEGAEGDGIGEWASFTFQKKCNVKCITFKLGNWRNQDLYDDNNRPKGVLLRLGGQEFNLTFPDGKKAYMVTFSDEISASDIYFEIQSVYKGDEWDDTCVSEMTVYAE